MLTPRLTEKELQFKALFDSTRDRLFSFLYRLTQDAQQAEDILQQCYLKVWERFDQIAMEEDVIPLLKTYARNCWIDLLRRKAREESGLSQYRLSQESGVPADAGILNREMHAVLQDIIACMPSRRREIFRLIKMEGLSYKEVSHRLGISVNTIETQMAHAMKFIRRRLHAAGLVARGSGSFHGLPQ